MSDFEKWFKTTEAYKMLEEQNYFKMDLFFFVGARNQYRHSGVQVAYLTWQHQQAIIDSLKAQLNNMEACYIEKKKQVEGLRELRNKSAECIENLVNQKADYLDRVTKAIAHLDSFDLSQAGMNKLQRSIESALEALRGANA